MFVIYIALLLAVHQVLMIAAPGLALSINAHQVSRRAVCTPGQGDVNPASCKNWVALGFCNTTKTFMTKNCPVACGLCQAPQPIISPVCTADQADQLSPIQCNRYKSIGLCNSSNNDLQDFMMENCFVTCGNCQVLTTPNPTTSGQVTTGNTTPLPVTQGATTAPQPTPGRNVVFDTTPGPTTSQNTIPDTTTPYETTTGPASQRPTIKGLTNPLQTTVGPTILGSSTPPPTTPGATTQRHTTFGPTTITTLGPTTLLHNNQGWTTDRRSIAVLTSKGPATLRTTTTGHTTILENTTGATTQRPTTPQTGIAYQTTLGLKISMTQTTTGGPTPPKYSSNATTSGSTKTIQSLPSGNITVTLAIFSGRPDPMWKVSEDHNLYDSIQRLLGHARNDGFVYSHQNMPRRLGYKGIILQFPMVEYLIVGPHTRTLQEQILSTMPESFRDRVLLEVRSGVATPAVVMTRKKRFSPPYNSSFWNSNPTTRSRNNCYNYANDKVTNTFAQPGRGSGADFHAMNGADLQAAAVRDGLAVFNHQPVSLTRIPGPPAGTAHLVALFIDPGNFFKPGDFHWVRLDDNGRWSHKPGQAGVTDLDQSGHPIIDPRKANMGDYLFVSFMTSDKNIITIT